MVKVNQNVQADFNQANQPEQPSQKSLISIPPALMQMVPWIPLALEAMTGQKVPQLGGTMGEIQSSLQQVQFSLQQIIATQQQLRIKLESLESNASQQLTNLSQQLSNTNKSFHLLATETKRSLEFKPAKPEPNLNSLNAYETLNNQ